MIPHSAACKHHDILQYQLEKKEALASAKDSQRTQIVRYCFLSSIVSDGLFFIFTRKGIAKECLQSECFCVVCLKAYCLNKGNAFPLFECPRVTFIPIFSSIKEIWRLLCLIWQSSLKTTCPFVNMVMPSKSLAQQSRLSFKPNLVQSWRGCSLSYLILVTSRTNEK